MTIKQLKECLKRLRKHKQELETLKTFISLSKEDQEKYRRKLGIYND